MIHDGIKNILLAEIHSCNSYFERLFHVILDMSDLSKNEQLLSFVDTSNLILNDFLSERIFKPSFNNNSHETSRQTVGETRDRILAILTLFKTMASLGLSEKEVVEQTVHGLNELYKMAHRLHYTIITSTQTQPQIASSQATQGPLPVGSTITKIEIQFPMLGVLEMREPPHTPIPTFYINLENIYDIAATSRGPILSIENGRNKKFKEFQNLGHKALFDKDPKRALENFTKALSYKNNSETLTLMAWCHSLTGNNQEAKNYCLRAIRLDPDYGPPYNDLGSILLLEGEVDESLRWFQLAKNATNYPNREYPYVNAGRAYMAKKENERALEEFSRALSLAPLNKELEKAVAKLKRSMPISNHSSHFTPSRLPKHESIFDI